ncbi:hypothetical protein DL89DRAFT_149113 [Linderina pennispora]|uniref:Uncharacterized protein n=1 Tax=Linderina pennispora TaxID=61395 RepID=A0A1Y1W8R7_9FUNG|nr:uncharacterized protein DL89DRAFT_149113 [Linderina pennispora]ORX69931.1 hypothetical protein DL89DRAFT_149113 [Linderina pennispora]
MPLRCPTSCWGDAFAKKTGPYTPTSVGTICCQRPQLHPLCDGFMRATLAPQKARVLGWPLAWPKGPGAKQKTKMCLLAFGWVTFFACCGRSPHE